MTPIQARDRERAREILHGSSEDFAQNVELVAQALADERGRACKADAGGDNTDYHIGAIRTGDATA